ncbi:shematrin-like protein 2 [Ostrinia furnacalis]|uniref:shematrin-like protein 2 n=1 Tax=Ostrinia furnacalis TaxID=93504 RepID=UPI00104036CD|nr:shematrin-like protein 2 [Ostrinia furnacalis]
MKVVISVCTFAAAVLMAAGAPALPNVYLPEPSGILYPQQFLRDRRSFGGGYAAPCGGGGYLSPIHSGYGGYGGGHGGYGGGHAVYSGASSYGYGGPHYRADETGEGEVMNFSHMEQDMTEHMPMARYGGYGGHAGLAGLGGIGGQLAPAVLSGPAVGVFPNANVGGCNVPLLLSCSPSISAGRIVKSGYGGGYGGGAVVAAGANAYRGVDDQTPQDVHEEHAHEEMTAHDSVEHVSDSVHTEQHQ